MKIHMLPSECGMPDLSDLDFPLINRLLVVLRGYGDKGLSPKAGSYRKIFVRLTDKALIEYQGARAAFMKQTEVLKRSAEEGVKDGRFLYTIEFDNHFENCINAVKRLLNLLNRIKGERGAPDISRSIRKLIDKVGNSISKVRHTIEHMDERIQQDLLKEGESMLLRMGEKGDRAEIAGHILMFCDLELVLRKLYKISWLLIEHSAK